MNSVNILEMAPSCHSFETASGRSCLSDKETRWALTAVSRKEAKEEGDCRVVCGGLQIHLLRATQSSEGRSHDQRPLLHKEHGILIFYCGCFILFILFHILFILFYIVSYLEAPSRCERVGYKIRVGSDPQHQA